MLNLKLTVDQRFMLDEMVNRKAVVTIVPEKAEDSSWNAQASVTSVAGTFNIFNAGAAKNCAITADAECPVLGARYEVPSDLAVTLTADAIKRVHFPKGVTSVDTKLHAGDSETFTVTPTGYSAAAVGDAGKKTIVVTRTSGTDDAVVDITFKAINVATGTGEDPNCNGLFYMKPNLGTVHIDAVCEWAHYAGMKPNPTHLNVRALDPHTFAFTLEMPTGLHK